MTDAILVGATGRLGRAVLDLSDAAGVRITAAVSPSAPGADLSPPAHADLPAALAAGHRGVVLDVAVAGGAAGRIRAAADAGLPLVMGATGLDADAERALDDAAARVAVVVAPNFSPGVTLLRRALRAVGTGIPGDWDLSVLDRHHRAKADRPSGTAASLSRELEPHRPEVASFRQGGVPGEHTAYWSGPEEELVFTHRALSRAVFARGALAAVRWAASAGPGRHGMDDVLGGTGQG